METLFVNLKKYSKATQEIYKTLSPERVLFLWITLGLACVLIFASALVYNSRFTSLVPSLGGSVQEGIIGTSRFINPVLASSDQDLDLVSLVFAGLTKRDEHGNMILDIAESIEESEDKLRYDVALKKEAQFHDGTQVTTDDFVYTISLIQNPIIKSPSRVLFEGITIEKKDDTSFTIVLKKPFPLIMQALTVGILPKHVWKNLTDEQFSLSDYNIHAIGAGPYKINDVTTDSGIPVSFSLVPHKKYTLGRPNIEDIELNMYQNEKYALQAFSDNDINRLNGITPEKISTLSVATSSIKTSVLPRTFTIFFNPNKAAFLSDKKVRQALNMAIDKQAIVTSVLKGYGKVIETPFPFDSDQPKPIYNVELAKEILSQSKYTKKASTTLSVVLTTANTPEMKLVAEMIKKNWEDLGVNTTILVYEFSDLNQTIIKERDYQALLFGTLTKSPADLYAFWHSSQRAYPGLNISNYVSNTLDKNLTILRNDTDELNRVTAYDLVKKEFSDEVPGIFLYAPLLIYITNDSVTSPMPDFSTDNSSRFLLVHSWYRYTERVWKKTYYQPLVQTLNNIIH